MYVKISGLSLRTSVSKRGGGCGALPVQCKSDRFPIILASGGPAAPQINTAALTNSSSRSFNFNCWESSPFCPTWAQPRCSTFTHRGWRAESEGEACGGVADLTGLSGLSLWSSGPSHFLSSQLLLLLCVQPWLHTHTQPQISVYRRSVAGVRPLQRLCTMAILEHNAWKSKQKLIIFFS